MADTQAKVQEKVRSLLSRAQELRELGADEHTNPEMKMIIDQLREIQTRIKAYKQSQLDQGSPSPVSSSINGEVSATRDETNSSDLKKVAALDHDDAIEVDGELADPLPAFSEGQVELLKLQIHAYRQLSKNLPIPNKVRRAIFNTGATDAFGTPLPSVNVGLRLLEQTALGSAAELEAVQTGKATPTQGIPLFNISRESNPYQYIPKDISYYQHRMRSQRALVPSVMPVPLDVGRLLNDLELRKRARMELRMKELEDMPGSLSNEDAKLRALIELKSLRLLEKQRRLRESIVRGLAKSTTLLTSLDRAACKRIRPPTLRDARSTEQMEKRQRVEREKKEKSKHLEQVTAMLTHGQRLLMVHRLAAKRATQLGTAVARYHAVCEKEEQKRLQRIAQERMRALKADDEEAYLRLLDKNKDKRIVHLLQATQSYLNDLTTSVLSQQESIDTETDDLIPLVGQGVSAAVIDDDQDKRDYYHITHRVKEEVTKQPSIMVGGTLKDYQLKGLEWMISLYNNRLNGILADEMGLGKTIQTISLVTYLIEMKKQSGPFLIIVPLSTITNWTLEFERWAPSVSKIVYKGVPQRRKELAAEIRLKQFNVLLTTYEYISRDKNVLSKLKWVYVIIDEGHRLKNAKSTLAVTLSTCYSFRYRLILTGTPLQNNLPELWALLNFVLPRIFNSVKSFDEWFSSPFAGMGSGQDRLELSEEEQLLIIKRLHKVLRPFLLRRLKKDVEADLPDKVEMVLKCKLSLLQQKLYEMVRTGTLILKEDDSKTVRVSGLNNRVMQMRKICNHPFVFREIEDMINPAGISDSSLFRTAGKFELLDRILPKLKRTNHRVLMFFQMTAIMDIMEDYLRFRGFKHLRLDGSTKTEDRQQMLADFNAKDSQYDVFLLSTRAGGLGLNLQTADTVIIFDSDWNPHQDLQAQDRAHRIGQTKEVRVYRLVTAKSVEEDILNAAQYKLNIDDKVIQAGKFDNRSSVEEREAFLKALIQGDNELNEDEDESEITDEDLNELLARDEDEMKIFQKLDEERIASELELHGPNWSRLIAQSELPNFYSKNMEEMRAELDQSTAAEIGSRRAKNQIISYKEDIPEDKFLQLIDAGHTPEEIQIMYEEKRKRREERKRLKSQAASEAATTEPTIKPIKIRNPEALAALASSGGSGRGTPSKRGRGRGRGRGGGRGRPRKNPLPETVASDSEPETPRKEEQSMSDSDSSAKSLSGSPEEGEVDNDDDDVSMN